MLPLIVGIGLQTPLGTSLDSTWRSLIGGRFITDHARVPVKPPAGRSRLVEIATAAARESLADADVDVGALRDIGLVVGTSKGPIEQWLTTAPDTHTHPSPPPEYRGRGTGDSSMGPSPLQFSSRGLQPTGLSDLADQICRGVGIGGPRSTTSAACASGLHALIRGAMLIRSGEMQRVLVVAAESSLHPLFIGNFQRLGVLPPTSYGCRPFDRERRGFVMSEAAAAVVLEAPGLRPSASRRLIAVERFAFAGDATHITGTDPSGKALRHILAAVIDGRGIDLVHAHGTGTDANDPVELAALQATLPRGFPPPTLYSHKGALGHSLGASGLVSVVLNCKSHQRGIIPGNVQTAHPIESTGLEIRQMPSDRTVQRSVALAAGFGGAMAAVSLISID